MPFLSNHIDWYLALVTTGEGVWVQTGRICREFRVKMGKFRVKTFRLLTVYRFVITYSGVKTLPVVNFHTISLRILRESSEKSLSNVTFKIVCYLRSGAVNDCQHLSRI